MAPPHFQRNPQTWHSLWHPSLPTSEQVEACKRDLGSALGPLAWLLVHNVFVHPVAGLVWVAAEVLDRPRWAVWADRLHDFSAPDATIPAAEHLQDEQGSATTTEVRPLTYCPCGHGAYFHSHGWNGGGCNVGGCDCENDLDTAATHPGPTEGRA